MDDFQENFQTTSPNHNNSHSTEDLIDFFETSLSPETNAFYFEDPANYSCPNKFSITPKSVTVPKINKRLPFKDLDTGTMSEFIVVSRAGKIGKAGSCTWKN